MFSRRELPRPFFYLLLTLLLLSGLSFAGVFRPLRALIERVTVIPLKEEVYRWQRFFKKDLGGCRLENEKEVAELKTQLASLLEENQEQKRLLSAPLPKNWQFLPAEVIGVADETLTINLGRLDGIKEGTAAVSGRTYLGKVSQVSEKISQVRLPSFLEERLVVRVVTGETSAGQNIKGSGLLIGRGQGKARLEQILSSETVENGDLVITSVEGGDLLVGEIEKVTEDKGEVFKVAQVKSVYNPEELKTIFLIRGKI